MRSKSRSEPRFFTMHQTIALHIDKVFDTTARFDEFPK